MNRPRYRNPIPIMLTAEEESQFYQPITNLLNRLVQAKVLIQNENYFTLLVRYEGLPVCIQAFKTLGISFDKATMTLDNDIVQLDARKAFNEYAARVRSSFTMTHFQGATPVYLDEKGKLFYCGAVCENKTCELEGVPYCTRLYVAVEYTGNTDK